MEHYAGITSARLGLVIFTSDWYYIYSNTKILYFERQTFYDHKLVK